MEMKWIDTGCVYSDFEMVYHMPKGEIMRNPKSTNMSSKLSLGDVFSRYLKKC